MHVHKLVPHWATHHRGAWQPSHAEPMLARGLRGISYAALGLLCLRRLRRVAAHAALTLRRSQRAPELGEVTAKGPRDFLGMVSHELRTPVTIFQLQLERLRRICGARDPKQQELLDRMSTTARRMGTLVDSLLNYARIRSGLPRTSSRMFDARELAREVVDDLHVQAEAKGLAFDLDACAEHALLCSDPELVRLVLVNLASNAIKFTEHGRVELGVQRGIHEVRLSVRDTGPGIAFAERGRIFEPFEHIEPASDRQTPGVGLGLALVREIAGALGGHVDVSSEPGRGSAFTIWLPNATH